MEIKTKNKNIYKDKLKINFRTKIFNSNPNSNNIAVVSE